MTQAMETALLDTNLCFFPKTTKSVKRIETELDKFGLILMYIIYVFLKIWIDV